MYKRQGWQAVRRISANRLVRDKQNGMRKPAFVSNMSFALIVQNKYRYYRDSFQKVKSLNSLVCMELRRTALHLVIFRRYIQRLFYLVNYSCGVNDS